MNVSHACIWKIKPAWTKATIRKIGHSLSQCASSTFNRRKHSNRVRVKCSFKCGMKMKYIILPTLHAKRKTIAVSLVFKWQIGKSFCFVLFMWQKNCFCLPPLGRKPSTDTVQMRMRFIRKSTGICCRPNRCSKLLICMALEKMQDLSACKLVGFPSATATTSTDTKNTIIVASTPSQSRYCSLNIVWIVRRTCGLITFLRSCTSSWILHKPTSLRMVSSTCDFSKPHSRYNFPSSSGSLGLAPSLHYKCTSVSDGNALHQYP